VSLCLFRIVEEGLSNIAKHSDARSGEVRVTGETNGIRLTVEDSGSGFDPVAIQKKAGLGFVSMQERLRVLRGTVRVDSAPARGTRIDVWIPTTTVVENAGEEAPDHLASSGEPRSSARPR
jgi:signal transduction histidine kinase